MIEVKEILDDFEIIDVQTLSTDYGISDDRASIAVSLYNKALNKMHIGSYDSARIDLRKSVNMYPSFVESRMLLGVCVFALGDRSDAVGIFNSIKGDNRERALDYLEKLHELSTRPESASFRSVSRQSRVPEAVFASDNKLDEIMNSSSKHSSNSINGDEVTEKNESMSEDSDVDVVVNDDKDESAGNETQGDTGESQTDFDIESDKTDKKIVETDIDYVKNNIVSKEKFDDNIAPYGTIRGQNRRQRYNNVSESISRENHSDDETLPQKKRNSESENLARAKRTISNLTIKKARITVLAMAMGLCCVILLISVICMSVSNSNLKKEIAELNEKIVLLGDGSGGNVNDPANGSDNVSSDDSSAGDTNLNPGTNDGNTEDMSAKATAAYNNAKTLYDSGKYTEAADLLAETDLSYLDYTTKAEAEALYKNSVDKFTNEYFNKMYSNVGPGNWDAVIEYGLPVYTHNIEHHNSSFTSGSAVCFNLGKAYESIGDKEKAREFYQTTINMYPSSSDAGYAEYRLSQL